MRALRLGLLLAAIALPVQAQIGPSGGLGLPQASGAFTCTSAGVCTLNPVSAIATSLAIGACTIGANAVCVAGTANISGALTLGTSGNLIGGTNLIEQYNGLNGQALNEYNLRVDASNFELATFGYASNTLFIGTKKSGSGVARNITIGSNVNGNPDANVSIYGLPINFGSLSTGTLNWSFSTGGHLVVLSNDLYDIGATATRPRTLYLGATDATTTTSGALQIAGGVAIRKRVFIDGISASAGLQTAVLCQSSGGEMIADSVACLASAKKVKDEHDLLPDGALAKLMKLPIGLWSYKSEGLFTSSAWTRERVGPYADDVEKMDRRLVGYGSDGKVRTYSTEQLLGYTIKALQEAVGRIEQLEQR